MDRRLNCRTPGCKKPCVIKKVKYRHSTSFRVEGYCVDHIAVRGRPVCVVDGCEAASATSHKTGKKVFLGYCAAHWKEIHHAATAKGVAKRKKNRPERKIDKSGYAWILIDGYYASEHRTVMERELGRKLKGNETVHHINGQRDQNHPSNLELWLGPIRAGVRARDMKCPHCGEPYARRESD